MFFSEILSKNFKHIRSTYNFSISELSEFLDLNTTSVVGGIETNRGLPSLSLLIRFALKFGLSTDWLIGFSDIVYTSESISVAEKDLEDQLREHDLPILSLRTLLIDDRWKNPAIRGKNFSLGVRANIVVLANWIIFQSQNPKLNNKNKQRLADFEKLILNQTGLPLFDVEKKEF